MFTELIKWNSLFKLKEHFEKLLVIEKLELLFNFKSMQLLFLHL